jgi:hypothetical protein
MAEHDLSPRIDQIVTRLREHLATPALISVEQQKLVACLINTLPYLQRLKSARIHVAQAELATDAALRDPPDLVLVEGIVRELHRRIEVYKSTLRSVVEGSTPASPVLLGLICHTVLAGCLLFGLSIVVRSWACGFPQAASLPWVLVGGSLGGLVSLLVRLHDFAVLARWAPDSDPRLLFYTGLLKPFVSIVFAFFVWAALHIGVVALPALGTAPHPTLLAFVVAFVTGFSERLAPDIANRTFPPGPTNAA